MRSRDASWPRASVTSGSSRATASVAPGILARPRRESYGSEAIIGVAYRLATSRPLGSDDFNGGTLGAGQRAGHSVEALWRIYAGCIDGQQPLWNQRIEEALCDGKKKQRTNRPMIIRTGPDLFRHCSVNSRQERGTAGNHRQQTTTARGRVSAGQGPFLLVVAGVGFEPT